MYLATMITPQNFVQHNHQNWFHWARQQVGLVGDGSQEGDDVLKRPLMANSLQKITTKQRSAFALIAWNVAGERHYLLQWNENWQAYNLIGGKMDNEKGDNDDFLRTVCRELEEETGLSAVKDCWVSPKMVGIEVRQYSRREKRLKEYQFGVFEVSLFPQLALTPEQLVSTVKWLSTGRQNQLVTAAEIDRLYTVSDRPISPTTRFILQEMGHLAV